MNTITRQDRIKALAERSSYVETVLRQALIAQLSSVAWLRNPNETLQVFSSEVDDEGFDLVLAYRGRSRYIQLKQAHNEKSRGHCSVRLSFSKMPSSCVVLMSHTITDLTLDGFRFFGGEPTQPMAAIDGLRATKAPGRRDASGRRKVREHYRDVPVSRFSKRLSSEGLFEVLFPPERAEKPSEEGESLSGAAAPASAIPDGSPSRTWTLRESDHAHHHNVVRLAESPLYLRLHWRSESQTPPHEVGVFRLDLARLLEDRFVRYEGLDKRRVRLRIKHARNGKFYIQTKDGAPRKVLLGARVPS